MSTTHTIRKPNTSVQMLRFLDGFKYKGYALVGEGSDKTWMLAVDGWAGGSKKHVATLAEERIAQYVASLVTVQHPCN